MLRGVQFDDPKNYVAAAIPSERENTRNKTLVEMLGSQDPLSQTLARDLQLGMTGPQSASRRRTDLIAPEEVNLLKAQTGDVAANRAQEGALNEANIGLRNQQRNTSGALMSKYGQETSNLMTQGLLDFDTGMLNIERINAQIGQDAAESAVKINASKSKKAENDKNFQLANEKLIQLQKEGKDKETAMDNLRKIKVKGDLTLADFAAVGGLSNVFDQGVYGGSNTRGESSAIGLISKTMDRLGKIGNTTRYTVTVNGKPKRMLYNQMDDKQRAEVLYRETSQGFQILRAAGYNPDRPNMMNLINQQLKAGSDLGTALANQGTSQGGGGSKPLNSGSASKIANKFRNSRPKPTN
jgi:hypothetical protein